MGDNKTYFFYPVGDEIFKKQALEGECVHTIVVNSQNEIEIAFTRVVETKWATSCKNNIATDGKIKKLSPNEIYKIFSWAPGKAK